MRNIAMISSVSNHYLYNVMSLVQGTLLCIWTFSLFLTANLSYILISRYLFSWLCSHLAIIQPVADFSDLIVLEEFAHSFTVTHRLYMYVKRYALQKEPNTN